MGCRRPRRHAPRSAATRVPRPAGCALGSFRLTCRLVAQIQRVLDINHLSVVTREVVEAARESLVIGII